MEITKRELNQAVARVKEKVTEVGDCWIWPASVKGTYPVLSLKGRMVNVRRLVFLHKSRRQALPPHQITSKCGNPACVSPRCLLPSRVPNRRPDRIRLTVVENKKELPK